MRIFTGALMPEGADTVVMQENTEALEGAVRIRELPTPRANVRKRGSDMRAGDLMLTAGSVLGPGEIGLLASQSYASVQVPRTPRVAILSTGDEVRDLGEPLPPGHIVNSNAYALAAHVQQAGGEPWILPTARDDRADLREKILLGLQADVLISAGGVSVGDHDLVAPVLAELGIEVLLHKVAMKPGKPLLFAVHEGVHHAVPIVGLPGNPVSAFVGFELFVRPGLRRMLGHAALHRPHARVTLAHDAAHKTGRTELARASLSPSERDNSHALVARLHEKQGSGSLPSLAYADALVILPAEQERFAAGTQLDALLLHDQPGSATTPFR